MINILEYFRFTQKLFGPSWDSNWHADTGVVFYVSKKFHTWRNEYFFPALLFDFAVAVLTIRTQQRKQADDDENYEAQQLHETLRN